MIKFYSETTKIGNLEISTRALSKKQIKEFIDLQVNHYGRTIIKNSRKIANELIKKDDFIFTGKSQNPVKSLEISIEWKKSYMYGSNPYATVSISFFDGTFKRIDGFTCSGYGYDKESTVIAQIFNETLLYRLYALQGCSKKIDAIPYGAYVDFEKNWIRFNGGVGTNCYYGLTEALGGKFKRVASGKAYDAYIINFKK